MPVQTINAQFEHSGDSDWFRIHFEAGHTYSVTSIASNQNLLLGFMQPDGQMMRFPVTFSNAQTFVAPVTGDYFITATSLGGQSPAAYSLTVEDLADPYPGWTGTPHSLAVGQTLAMPPSSPAIMNDDWFAIDLVAGQSYVLASSSIVHDVYITDAGGAVVAIERAGGQQVHFTASESGRYYAGVAHGGGSGYNLTLLAIADDHGDISIGAGTLAVGSSVDGLWESAGDDDGYAVDLDAGSSYVFSLVNLDDATLLGSLQVHDQSGALVWTSLGQGQPQTTIFSPDANGTYYVTASLHTVSTQSGSSTYLNGWDYRLSAVTVAGDLTDNALTTGLLTVGGAQTAGTWEVAGDHDWLKVDLVAGQSYLFDLATSNWNGVGLAMFDGQGHQVSVAGGYTPSGARLVHTAAESGSYFVSALVGLQTGGYTLSATAIADDFANNALTTGHLAVGGIASGVSESGADTDWFAIALTAGVTYLLEADSSGVGLAIRGADGTLLTLANWGDETFTPTATGTYFVEAGGANGAYSFTVGPEFDDYAEGSATTGVFRLDVNGTAGADTFVSTGVYEHFIGGGGDDLFIPSTGYDWFEGGAGIDTVSYADFGQAIDVELWDGRSLANGVQRDEVQVENVIGTAFDDVINGSALANRLEGGTGNDILGGLSGNDVLIGGGGADTMSGGTGNDTYFVDSAGDQTIERVAQGADIVYTSTNYELTGNSEVEILSPDSLGGTAALTLVGNNLVQLIYGNAGANLLTGGGGADQLVGFGGDDTYIITDGAEAVFEAAGGGTDIVYTHVSHGLAGGQEIELLSAASNSATTAMDLTGNELANTIYGNNGVNNLRGGGGNGDKLIGLGGNDVYFIVSGTEQLFELAGGGNDVVYTNVSHALVSGQEIEILSAISIAATNAMDLTGNELANVIYGNDGVNNLRGGGGSGDILIGFGGNDVYFIVSGSEQVVEGADAGSDVVYTNVNHALAAGQEIEYLSAVSNGATTTMDLTGNAFGNQVHGNNGVNVINGGAGADFLVGYGGADSFAFTTALGGGNVDTLGDFLEGSDKILLDDAVFAGLGLGQLSANAFVIGPAQDADDRIIYNSATGAILFDADGNGAGAAVQFAWVAQNTLLTANDFTVI